SFHVIAGRSSEDPDLDKDLAFMYLSMKTNVDDNLGLSSVESASNDLPAAVMKSDAVRLVFRKNIKISLDGGKNYVHIDKDGCTIKIGSSSSKMSGDKITIGSGKIELGEGAQQKIILGDNFKNFFVGHTHQTPTGGG